MDQLNTTYIIVFVFKETETDIVSTFKQEGVS